MTNPSINNDDEIDLVELIAQLYRSRSFIIKTTLIAVLIGVLVALLSPVKFKSATVFIVESETEQMGSSLSGLAALAGINLNSSSNGGIPPSLYPKIVSSLAFKLAILEKQLPSVKLKYGEYLQNSPQKGFLPSGILNLFKSDTKESISKKNESYLTIDEDTFELTKTLDELISVEVNEKEGFVSLSVVDESAEVAALITSKSLELLQNTIINYKTDNAKRVLTYLEEQYQSKSSEYFQIQKELAEFKDQNKNISTAVFESNLQKLQTRYDLIYAVYLELSKQIEQAKLQVNRDIPNISVIEPVMVPMERDSPKRKLIVVIFSFLGVVLSCGWVLIKVPIHQIYSQVKQ